MIKNKPVLTKDKVETLHESKFLKVYGLEYLEGWQYMDASRRPKEDISATKTVEEFKKMLPDAVSIIVVIDSPEPKLLLMYEFRYPTGQYLLSVPAGLIDEADKAGENPLFVTAERELKEEANVILTDKDRLKVVNPLLFSSPGISDESNAIVCAVISEDTPLNLNQEGGESTECFDGFELLTVEEAKRILDQGVDDNGIFYSVFTWMALVYFVSGLWR